MSSLAADLRSKLAVLACLVAAFALMAAGAAAQETPEPTPPADEPDVEQPDTVQPDADDPGFLVLVLDEVDDSGVNGFAIMLDDQQDMQQPNGMQEPGNGAATENGDVTNGDAPNGDVANGQDMDNGQQQVNGQQQISTLVLAQTDNDEDLGQVALLEGTCDDPESIAEEYGDMQSLQQDAYALRVSIDRSLDELQDNNYALAILDQDATEDDIDVLACGDLADAEEVDEDDVEDDDNDVDVDADNDDDENDEVDVEA